MRTPTKLLLAAGIMMLGATTAFAQGTVTCKDGSKSKGGQGACSGHGGVMQAGGTKDDAKAAKPAKADTKADAKADTKAAKPAKEEKKAAKAEAKDDSKDAKGATAECKDHTYSHSASRQGACSSHGGVLKWLDGKK